MINENNMTTIVSQTNSATYYATFPSGRTHPFGILLIPAEQGIILIWPLPNWNGHFLLNMGAMAISPAR